MLRYVITRVCERTCHVIMHLVVRRYFFMILIDAFALELLETIEDIFLPYG